MVSWLVTTSDGDRAAEAFGFPSRPPRLGTKGLRVACRSKGGAAAQKRWMGCAGTRGAGYDRENRVMVVLRAMAAFLGGGRAWEASPGAFLFPRRARRGATGRNRPEGARAKPERLPGREAARKRTGRPRFGSGPGELQPWGRVVAWCGFFRGCWPDVSGWSSKVKIGSVSFWPTSV